MTASPDPRPFTAVLHQFVGMGDLVWHIAYFKALADRSRDGQVSVIASPTTFARDLLGHEPWVREVIDFDRRPRRSEKRQGVHSGVPGLFRMGRDLRPYGFERIVLFSHHANRGLVAWWAGIPQRLGYGSSAIQRLFLTEGPYIEAYRGASVPVHKDATAFMLAQGWCDAPVVPRITVHPQALADMRERLAAYPGPRYGFAIGTSEPFKQWGTANFAALAQALIRRGGSVILLGGPAEREVAQAIVDAVPAADRTRLLAMTDGTVRETVATLALCDAGLGNDTGVSNMAAAVGKPSYVLLGPRPLLDHDPLMRLLTGPVLADITVDDVLARLQADRAPGFDGPEA